MQDVPGLRDYAELHDRAVMESGALYAGYADRGQQFMLAISIMILLILPACFSGRWHSPAPISDGS